MPPSSHRDDIRKRRRRLEDVAIRKCKLKKPLFARYWPLGANKMSRFALRRSYDTRTLSNVS